jgi:hypothetical protein
LPPTFDGHALRRKLAPGSSKKVLYDDYPGPPLKPGERYTESFSEDGEPFCHIYEQDEWDEFLQPQTRFQIFGVITPKDSYEVPKTYPPRWEVELGDILTLLRDKKIPARRAEKLANELADLYHEYDILMKVVKQQRAEYRHVKKLFLKINKELNANL